MKQEDPILIKYPDYKEDMRVIRAARGSVCGMMNRRDLDPSKKIFTANRVVAYIGGSPVVYADNLKYSLKIEDDE